MPARSRLRRPGPVPGWCAKSFVAAHEVFPGCGDEQAWVVSDSSDGGGDLGVAGLVGQSLGAQQRQDPLDGVRMWRLAPAVGSTPTPQPGQQRLICGHDPPGDLGRVTHPANTAAVHDPRIAASAWRIPRLSRASGIAAKHSSRLPPLTRCSAAACSTTTTIAASSGEGTFWVLTH